MRTFQILKIIINVNIAFILTYTVYPSIMIWWLCGMLIDVYLFCSRGFSFIYFLPLVCYLKKKYCNRVIHMKNTVNYWYYNMVKIFLWNSFSDLWCYLSIKTWVVLTRYGYSGPKVANLVVIKSPKHYR